MKCAALQKKSIGEVEQVDNQTCIPIGVGETWTSLRWKGEHGRNRPPFWDFVINEKVPKTCLRNARC